MKRVSMEKSKRKLLHMGDEAVSDKKIKAKPAS
jgi:hypothetical protein